MAEFEQIMIYCTYGGWKKLFKAPQISDSTLQELLEQIISSSRSIYYKSHQAMKRKKKL